MIEDVVLQNEVEVFKISVSDKKTFLDCTEIPQHEYKVQRMRKSITFSMNQRKIQFGYLVLLIALPIILWFLPSNFFDHGKIIVCISRRFFNIECLGCGMTRSVMHFHHFEFQKAFDFNKGVIFVYPLIVWIWYRWVKTATKKCRFLK